MCFLCGFFYLFILNLFLKQTVSGETFILKDGGTTYLYDDIDILGEGGAGAVYKGKRIDGNRSDVVAIKVAKNDSLNFYLKFEKDIYEKIGDHDSIPKLYSFFPDARDSGRSGAVLVTGLLGNSLFQLLPSFKRFSVITVMKIGLQALDALEHIHSKNLIHNDIHPGNFALDFNNDSKINMLDFNLSEEFEVIGESIIVKENPQNERHNKFNSPRNDINALALLLIEFMRGLLPVDLYWDLKWDDKREITSTENNIIFKNVECKEALIEFLLTARDPKHDLPDYEVFKNILRTELDKHKNEPNYDQFDWQINDEIEEEYCQIQ